MKMSKWYRTNSFVCLDDITGRYEEYNPVIYNPRKVIDINERKQILAKHVKNAFGLSIGDSDLDRLCRYETCHSYNSSIDTNNDENQNMLIGFINDLRGIVNLR